MGCDYMSLSMIDDQIKNCHKCSDMVSKFEQKTTVSMGNRTDILLLGEAPANNGWRKSGVAWYDTNHQLLRSGDILERLLQLVDYHLNDTCFVEVVKCYPKERKYLKICSQNCKQYLIEQIRIIHPKIILPLGDVATKSLLDISYSKFSDVAGKVFTYQDIDVIPIYHPSPISPVSYKGNVPIFEGVIKEKVKIYK